MEQVTTYTYRSPKIVVPHSPTHAHAHHTYWYKLRNGTYSTAAVRFLSAPEGFFGLWVVW